MNETSQDHEFEHRMRPRRRQMIGTGAWVLTITTAVVVTSIQPELTNLVGVTLAGLGLLVAGTKR